MPDWYTDKGYRMSKCAPMRCRAVSVQLMTGGDVELTHEPAEARLVRRREGQSAAQAAEIIQSSCVPSHSFNTMRTPWRARALAAGPMKAVVR